MSNRTVLTSTHIGQDVPLEVAAPFMIARIGSKLKVTEKGCWEYQGDRNEGGYGQAIIGGKRWMIHRLMYKLAKGRLARSLDVLHDCDNPCCCNPTHLHLGDPKTNSRETVERGRHHKASRDTCPRGHSYAEHGVYYAKGKNWRTCKVCARGRLRVKAGWPEDLVYSAPVAQGRRPETAGPPKPTTWKKGSGVCMRGHKIEGENIYPKPGGGKQCKICHDIAAKRRVKELKPIRRPASASGDSNG